MQTSDTLQKLEVERVKMKRDIQQVLEDHKRIRDTAQNKVTRYQGKVQKITGNLELAVRKLGNSSEISGKPRTV